MQGWESIAWSRPQSSLATTILLVLSWIWLSCSGPMGRAILVCVFSGRVMKETVRWIREGWYGNGSTYHPVGHYLHKEPVNWLQQTLQGSTQGSCGKIHTTVREFLEPLGPWPTYHDNEVDIPIDALVLDLVIINDGEDEFRAQSWAAGKYRIFGGHVFWCMFICSSRLWAGLYNMHIYQNEALLLLFLSLCNLFVSI